MTTRPKDTGCHLANTHQSGYQRADIKWTAVESLVEALGGEVREGNGSRVRFELNGVRGNFHRPHPGNEAKRYQIRDLKEFLEAAGVEP